MKITSSKQGRLQAIVEIHWDADIEAAMESDFPTVEIPCEYTSVFKDGKNVVDQVRVLPATIPVQYTIMFFDEDEDPLDGGIALDLQKVQKIDHPAHDMNSLMNLVIYLDRQFMIDYRKTELHINCIVS